ncbi:MAG: PAS domain-containing protein [Clostridia bacterium]|nr:PAS domain-containing protein [Clostridia bacterium]
MRRLLRALGSIQVKMALALLLLALVAMQFISAFLLRSLEDYYLQRAREDLEASAAMAASIVLHSLAADPPDLAAVRDFVQSYGGLPGEAPRTDSQMVVVDGNGIVLGASSADVVVGNAFPAPEVKAYALQGVERTGSYEAKGVRHFTVAVPVSERGQIYGAVYLDRSLADVYQTLDDVRRTLFTATLLAAFVLVGLGVLVARAVTGPIHELTLRAGELAAGNFERRIQVRSDDEVGRLAGMFNHLSARLKETLDEISSEKQRVEAILTYLADGILALDREGRVTLINPAAARMLRLRAGEALGQRLRDLWPDEELGEALAESLAGAVVRVQARRGEPPRTLAGHLAPLGGEPGDVTGVVIVVRDVTEEEQVESLRREFVANVSHELKTPITAIKSYVETLLDGALADRETATGFLSVVASEVDRMTRMIDDLLQLSRMEHERRFWDRRPLQVGPLADEVCRKLERRTKKKGLTVACRAEPGLPPALADRDRVEQLLTNLVTNAIDFTPEGGRVEVVVGRKGGDIEVLVRDTGIGIPDEDLPRVFERFYRVDKARSREFGGTGLGLSIAKEIVEGHGGAIEIRSRLGEGTEVRFTLPIVGEGYGRLGGGHSEAEAEPAEGSRRP